MWYILKINPRHHKKGFEWNFVRDCWSTIRIWPPKVVNQSITDSQNSISWVVNDWEHVNLLWSDQSFHQQFFFCGLLNVEGVRWADFLTGGCALVLDQSKIGCVLINSRIWWNPAQVVLIADQNLISRSSGSPLILPGGFSPYFGYLDILQISLNDFALSNKQSYHFVKSWSWGWKRFPPIGKRRSPRIASSILDSLTSAFQTSGTGLHLRLLVDTLSCEACKRTETKRKWHALSHSDHDSIMRCSRIPGIWKTRVWLGKQKIGVTWCW